MILYRKTPIVEVASGMLTKAGIRLLVKREDLNHPEISGNKWWKLKYNLEQAKVLGKTTLLTLGGAYSNHIYSTAAAAREAGFNSIGIIRGEEVLPLNKTLQFATDCGMKLHFISRERYRAREDGNFVKDLQNDFGDFYFIPEGGTNALAVKGCAELANEIEAAVDFDYLCLPVGTGGTLAGLVVGLGGRKKAVGVSVLKGGEFLSGEVSDMVFAYAGETYSGGWDILTEYHFGGYAKSKPELTRFIEATEQTWNFPLDAVYTGKALFAVMDRVGAGWFSRGSTVLFLHTGGLQGK
ncbi:MAG: pyridoxal-phosphate dependent enzyme [Cytophagales bacterium]|nr:pyridoxal-phosphate dependent enzyme [Cytophagales bacterium]